MATYKLIQDIEAEDKILGPLTLRQFIFGMVAAFCAYLSVFFVLKNVAFLAIFTVPIALFCGLFAFPFGRDQPTEIWLLAKFRYWFVPRTRIWNQTGVKELVTITVPKKVERVLTDGLSQTEVKGRLEALASTIDSRGWAVKNVSTYTPSMMAGGANDDRLISLSSMPREVPDENDAIMAADILDPATNPVAYQMYNMVDQSEQAHHKQLISRLNTATQPVARQASNWFMNSGASTTRQAAAPAAAPVAAPMSSDEAALSQQLRARASSKAMATDHLASLRPHSNQPTPVPQARQAQPVPARKAAPKTTNDPALLRLATNNDLDIATLARQAQQAKSGRLSEGDGEVVVSLH